MPPVPLRLPSLLTSLLPMVLVACTQPSTPQPVPARSAVMGAGMVLHSQTFELGLGGWTAQTLSGTGAWQVLTQPETLSISAELNPYAVTLADDGRHLPAPEGVSVARFGDATGTYIGSDYGIQDPKGGGFSTVRQAGTLTSPPIYLTEISFAQLEFESWWEIEGSAGANYDLMTVLLSVNGGAFQPLGNLNPGFVVQQPPEAAYSSGGPGAAPVVRHYLFDLSPYLGSEIRVQFQFDSDDQNYNAFRGFTVDNVQVIGSYEVSGPVLFAVQPSVAIGGDSIALTGANLHQGASFYVGSQQFLPHELTQFGAEHVVFSLPTLTPGLYDVRVVNPDGQEFTLPAALEYAGAASPTVTSITPNSASAGVSQGVSISGTNFQPGAVVLVGSVEGVTPLVHSAESITVTVPGLEAGTHNVTVRNSNGQSGTLYAAYTVANTVQPTFTTLSSPTNPSVETSAVQFTAFLSPAVSEGTVQFLVAGTPFGDPVPVQDGVAVSLPYVFSGGGYSITAQYSGTSGFTASSGSLFQEVDFIPVAHDLLLTTGEDQSLQFLLEGTDGDEDLLTYQLLSLPELGNLIGEPPSLAYLPPADFSGQVSFTYQVNDGRSDSRVATVTLIVEEINDPPVADSQSVSTAEDTARAIVVTASDVEGNPLTWTLVTPPMFGTLSGELPEVTYTPFANFNGQDSFQVQANEKYAQSNVAAVSITVTPVNDAPVAHAQAQTTEEDTGLELMLTGEDLDSAPPLLELSSGSLAQGMGASPLTFTVVTPPAHGTLTGVAPQLRYQPDANFFGVDSFTFRVNDGELDSEVATVALTVTAVNDAPVADSQSVSTAEDTARAISLTASDLEEDPLTWVVVTPPMFGTLSGELPEVTYTPSANFTGQDSFQVQANEKYAQSNVATVAITVTPVNDPPVAHAQSQTTGEDSGLDLTLTGEDLDAPPPTVIPDLTGQMEGARQALRLVAAPLTFTVVSPPSHGTLSGQAPQLRYQPDADFHGEDSFTFRVNDGELDSQEATVTLNVTPINDAPKADALALTLDEDVATPLTLGGSDVDQDPLEWKVVAQPQHGTLTGTAPALTYTPNPDFHGEDSFTYATGDGALESEVATVSLTIQSVNDAPHASQQQVLTEEDLSVAVTLEGSDTEEDALTFQVVNAPSHGTLSGVAPELTYSPAANFHGEDSFTFKTHDGQVDSEPRTVSITVAPINDAPVATARSASTEEDGEVGFTLSGTDVDGDGLTYSVVTQPSHGTLSGTPPQLTYTPYPDFTGQDSFTFQANDGDAHSAPATVTLTVGPVNDAPVAEGSAVITDEDTAAEFNLQAHDVDGDALAWTVLTAPQHGTLSGTAPNLTYQPAANFWGEDSFTFQVNDGLADSNVVTVSVGISSIDDAPVASAQAITLTEDMATTLNLQGTDTEGAALSYTVVSGPAHGTLSGEAPHLTYRPVADYEGEDSFTFLVTAEGMDSQPATVSITVGGSEDLLAGGGLGCSSTPGGFASWMLLALGGLLFRRGRAIPRSLGVLGALAVALTVPVARAQTALPSLEVEALRMNAGAADGLVSGSGLLLEQGALRLSLTGHHERDPLVYFRNGQRVGAIVANRASAHLAFAWAPLQWLEVGAQLPVVLLQSGDDLSQHGLGSPDQTTVGTSLLQARAALWQQSRGGLLDLALGLGVQLPLGGLSAVASEPGLLGQVEAGYALTSWLRLGGQLGLGLRPSSTFDGQSLRRSTVEGALLVHTVGKGLRGELSWHTALPTEGGPLRNELFAGARLPLGKWVEIYGLGGIGLGSAPGTPAYRILAGAAFLLGSKPAAKVSAPALAPAPDCAAQPQACPLADLDADGVTNADDVCPALAGLTAHQGCAAPEAPAVVAAPVCPSTPGSAATEQCPAVPLDEAAVAAIQTKLSEELKLGQLFQVSSAQLTPEFLPALERLARLVNAHPEIQQIRIEGHTDASGQALKNLALSLSRAKAVRDHLVSLGVAPTRLGAVGFGSQRPVASNATAEGREANRRVELLLQLNREPVPAS